MTRDLGQYIEHIQGADNAEEVYQRFLKIITAYGYDRMTYTLLTDSHSLNLKRQHGLVTNYPAEWMDYYIKNNYMAIDPVVIAAQQASAPFFWEDLKSRTDLPDGSLRILDEAAEVGVRDGICASFAGRGGELTGVGLARSQGTGQADKDYALMADLFLLSAFFHEKLIGFLSSKAIPPITAKERDILSWAAEGKTDEEIALLLRLSVHTVRWHWKNIFEKLGVRGRVNCITKSLLMGIIEPIRVRPTY